MLRSVTGRSLLSPRELATAIGVSESSLRRWADAGRVEMMRTAGGHRRIPVAEALKFVRRERLQVVRPDLLGLTSELVDEVGEELVDELGEELGKEHVDADRRLSDADADRRADASEGQSEELEESGPDRIASTLQALLLRGEWRGVSRLIEQLYMDGASLASLFDGPIRRALEPIGELWRRDEDGPKGIVLEHRATQIMFDTIHRFTALVPAPGRGAPVAVGGVPSADEHAMASLMACLVLTEHGYRAINLGMSTPTEVLVTAIETFSPEVVWRAICAPEMDPELVVEDLRRLAEVTAACGAALVVGGPSVTDAVTPRAPHVRRARCMEDLDDWARQWRAESHASRPEF